MPPTLRPGPTLPGIGGEEGRSLDVTAFRDWLQVRLGQLLLLSPSITLGLKCKHFPKNAGSCCQDFFPVSSSKCQELFLLITNQLAKYRCPWRKPFRLVRINELIQPKANKLIMLFFSLWLPEKMNLVHVFQSVHPK